MNPKDEIQKLIQSELKKWEDYDKKNVDFHTDQVNRFQPLRTLVLELIAPIEPEYIKADISDDRATIEVRNGNDKSSMMAWTLRPNFKVQGRQEEYWSQNLWQNKVNLEEVPGFKVEETQGEGGERILEFETVEEVIHSLARKIAKRVAFFRYSK